MPELHAETAYLFRHALVRDAAYELQPVSDRGKLHALALDLIEELCGGTPELQTPQWVGRFKPHTSDRLAMELAKHADASLHVLSGEDAKKARRKGAIYLFRSAVIEDRGYRHARALELFQRLAVHPGSDDHLRAHGHFASGQIHYQLGSLDGATRQYDQMARYVTREADPCGYQLLESVRTVVRSHSDNGPDIGAAHLRASEFWAKRGDRNRQLVSLINFAVWHCEEGDHDIARDALNRAILLARKIGNRRGEEAAAGTLALLNGVDGRTDEAIEGLRCALEMAREMNNNLAIQQWLTGLGDVQQQSGRLADAEASYREAIALATLHGLDARLCYAQSHLAAVLVELGRLPEARRLWEAGWAGLSARNDEYTRRGVLKGMRLALERAGLAPIGDDGQLA
ncbi:MAG: tetratricopeptide repeat protein [Planctomycetes bacterium]|nr:tetratricopeptide repeat protein [Planctomycetota bacterium]